MTIMGVLLACSAGIMASYDSQKPINITNTLRFDANVVLSCTVGTSTKYSKSVVAKANTTTVLPAIGVSSCLSAQLVPSVVGMTSMSTSILSNNKVTISEVVAFIPGSKTAKSYAVATQN